MNARELFESSLSTIDSVVAAVCRRARLRGADAEDFASTARVHLLDNDCAVLRRYEGRSSLAGYLMVVVSRLLSDERIHALGRWYPSTEATRLGPAAVLLEQLVLRDRRSIEEAVPIVTGTYRDLTRADAERIAERLPDRTPRLRFVELDGGELPSIPAPESAEASAMTTEARRLSETTSRVVRETLESFTLEDRTLIHLQYASSMSIADISRAMRLPQRPLYRRFERLLVSIRDALAAAGIDATSVHDMITTAIDEEMDFGLPPPISFTFKEGA
jgi:RNA polymerase sigma factor for flagellar operon FliA